MYSPTHHHIVIISLAPKPLILPFAAESQYRKFGIRRPSWKYGVPATSSSISAPPNRRAPPYPSGILNSDGSRPRRHGAVQHSRILMFVGMEVLHIS